MMRRHASVANNQLLEGVIDITTVVYDLTNTVNPEYDFEKVEVPEVICQESGKLQLWHSWQGQDALALEAIKKEFEANCPGVMVDLTGYATELELSDAISDTMPPHLIIGPANWVTGLSQKELIAPITTRVDPTIQQRYIPLTVDARLIC